MKKSRIILSLVVTFSLLFLTNDKRNSQVSFLDADTAVWRFRGFINFNPCHHIDVQIMLSKQDSIVGNYTYRKMYHLHRQGVISDCIERPLGSGGPIPSTPAFNGLIREEGRKVYYWDAQRDSEFLAYDFDQQVGDIVPLYADQEIEIRSITDVVLNGRVFKKYNIGGIWDIYEGIGTEKWPFLNFYDINPSVRLVCYSRNDTTYYQLYDSCGYYPYPPLVTNTDEELNLESHAEMRIQIYPNPSSNHVSIVCNAKGNSIIQVIDLLGETYNVQINQVGEELIVDVSQLLNGIYILMVKEDDIVVSVEKIIVLH